VAASFARDGSRFPFHSGPAWPPGPRRGQGVQGRVLAQPGRPGHGGGQGLQLPAGVGRVGHDADGAAGQRRGQPLRHPAGQPQAGPGIRVLDHQLRDHRHRDRPAHHGQPHDDGEDHPVVPVARLRRPGRGPVVEPRGGPDLLPPPAEQRVIDRHLDRFPFRDQQRHHQQGGGQPQVVSAPPGAGEEPVRPVVRPQARKVRAREHPAHRPLPRLREEPAGQAAERTKRRGREQRREDGQQRHQRRRDR
jgi:hypothetical protein